MRRGDAVRYVEVVLDDEPAAAPEPAAREISGRSGARRPWRTPAFWVVIALLLAGVVGVSGVQASAERRDAVALGRYAEVPGVVTASLRRPLTERWRLPESAGAAAVGDLVLTARSGAGLVARDGRTGRMRWAVPVPEGIAPSAVRCPHAGRRTADGTPTVLCVVASPTDAGPAGAAAGAAALDVDSGDVLELLPLPGRLLASSSVDGDLVVLLAVDGTLTAARHDLVRGREVWSTRLPDMFVGDPRLALRATSDIVAVQGVIGVVLDARDGREVDRWRPVGRPSQGMSVRVVPRTGEGFGVWTSPFLGRWHSPDGTPLAELRGYPIDPPVADDSTRGVALLGSDDGRRLAGVDVATGRERWQRPMPERVLLRLDGRLVAADDGSLEAVDVATGRRLWHVAPVAGDEPDLGPVLTDGRRLLVRGRDRSGALRLTAYDLDDGDRTWQAAVPGGGQSVSVLGGRLVSTDRRLDGGRAGVVRFLG